MIPVRHNSACVLRNCRIADSGFGSARSGPEVANSYDFGAAAAGVDAWHTAQTTPLRRDCFQDRASGTDRLRTRGYWPRKVVEEWSGSLAAASELAAAV